MKKLEVSQEDVIKLHQLASIYHEVGGKVKHLQKTISDAEVEITHLAEFLEKIKAEEEELYAQISQKHSITKGEAITVAINAMMHGKEV
jgi:hypothetical protein